MDTAFYAARIADRLRELGARVDHIDAELGVPKPRDMNDQAIDIEDDEVLERLGAAAEREVALLRDALGRIRAGTYGVCLDCGEPISQERLEAVPYTPVCKSCARGS